MKKQLLTGTILLSVLFLSGCSSSQDSAPTAEELNNAILNEMNTPDQANNKDTSTKTVTGTKYMNYGGDFNGGIDAGINNIRNAKFLVFPDKHSSNVYLIDRLNFDQWSADQKMPTELKETLQFYKSEIKEVSESYKGISEEITYYEILKLDSMTETVDVPQYN
jgi:hypothetical protein